MNTTCGGLLARGEVGEEREHLGEGMVAVAWSSMWLGGNGEGGCPLLQRRAGGVEEAMVPCSSLHPSVCSMARCPSSPATLYMVVAMAAIAAIALTLVLAVLRRSSNLSCDQ